jgi:hypothetical protein
MSETIITRDPDISLVSNVDDGDSINNTSTSKLGSTVIKSESDDGSSSIDVQVSTQSTGAQPVGDIPIAGTMIFDTTSALMYVSNGTVWNSIKLDYA